MFENNSIKDLYFPNDKKTIRNSRQSKHFIEQIVHHATGLPYKEVKVILGNDRKHTLFLKIKIQDYEIIELKSIKKEDYEKELK